jgi:hypothetical protein
MSVSATRTATKTAHRTLRHSTAWAAAELGVNERTVRRYIVGGQLGCDVLPGGHYRITEAHIHECRERALESKRRFREWAPGSASRDPKPSPRPRQRQRQGQRRPPLGQEPPPKHLDLSPHTLASLRSQFQSLIPACRQN